MQRGEKLRQNLKQVDKSHYEFQRYVTKSRWISLWHQLDEIIKLNPRNVLEIGPGPGILKAITSVFGLKIETLDLDPELHPDHIGSVTNMPFEDGAFDLVCAFQMLEHLPFEDSLSAIKEMARVSRRYIVISLPDAATRWPITIQLPRLGAVRFSVPRPRLGPPIHKFNGEHYWEINKKGYELNKVITRLTEMSGCTLLYSYRVHENQYHRFFVFQKLD